MRSEIPTLLSSGEPPHSEQPYVQGNKLILFKVEVCIQVLEVMCKTPGFLEK